MANVQPLPILQDGDPILREVAQPVPESMFGTDELRHIVEQLAVTLDGESDGVAIAAPQVGISYRIFLVRYDRTKPVVGDETGAPAARPSEIGVFINPSFVRSSRRRIEMDEGCLSVRGLYGTTLRNERATIRAYDVDGTMFERGGGGLLAQIYQHEYDHLEGILFIDHADHIVKVRRNEKTHQLEEIPVEDETADHE